MPVCCNKEMKLLEKLNLEPDGVFYDRTIYIFKCTNKKCNAIKYQLVEYNSANNTMVYDRNKPKRIKNVSEWLEKLEQHKSTFDDSFKIGNKSNMAFIFGKNLERKNKLVQIGVDFNGTERNKKEIVLNG